MSACPMCMGTDCAGACAQGYCYAEEQQRRFDEEEAERQYWEELYSDSCLAAEATGGDRS